jgi:hypothetical protein
MLNRSVTNDIVLSLLWNVMGFLDMSWTTAQTLSWLLFVLVQTWLLFHLCSHSNSEARSWFDYIFVPSTFSFQFASFWRIIILQKLNDVLFLSPHCPYLNHFFSENLWRIHINWTKLYLFNDFPLYTFYYKYTNYLERG